MKRNVSVVRSKFRYNILISGKIIKEMPGSVASGTHCIYILGALQTHTTDTFLFISHTMNIVLLKFRCNILIGVRIIKEMPGSVASGTHCIYMYIY